MVIIIKFGIKKNSILIQKIIWVETNYKKNDISIFSFIEKHDFKLREKLLKQLSFLSRKDNNFVNSYSIMEDYNIWELSTFLEKSLYKSNKFIVNCLKYIALDEITKNKKIKEIEINQSSLMEKKIINKICYKNNTKVTFSKIKLDIKFILNNFIFHIIKSFIYIPYYLIKNFYFINRIDLNIMNKFKSDLLVQGYFTNLKTNSGKYYSNQWSYVSELLNSNKIKSLYVHFHIHNNIKFKNSINLINKFNKNKHEHHIFLQDFLSVKIILKTLYYYITVLITNIINTKKIKNYITKSNTIFSHYQLINSEINESLFGVTCIKNILNILLIDSLFSNLYKKQKILYLQEFQSWEKIFIKASRNYNHKKVFAYQHAISRFWDLRYFNYYYLNTNTSKYINTIPDYIIVNGQFSENNLLLQNFNKKKIIRVETTRFLDLFSNIKPKFFKNNKILILGDYDKKFNNDFFYNLSTNKNYFNNYSFSYKSHPSIQENFSFKPLNFISNTVPLNKIIYNFSYIIVIGASTTSFSFFYTNSNFYIYRPLNTLNYNALKNIPGINTINDLSLVDLSTKINNNNKNNYNLNDLFNYNKNNSLWLNFIKEYLA